ncbi:MAG: response regulator [Deltaproteobacteria bacterium]|nr:response regulator [Deltaproteobacteria bacterium]
MKKEQSSLILIVDDQHYALQGISRIMKSGGYETIEASTGTDCLKFATEMKPDLILLDVVLPDIDGREVCKRIKSNPETKDIYVVLLSSIKTDSDSQANGLEHCADGYIAKPVPNRELLARVNSILRLKDTEKRLTEALEFNEKILATSCVGMATYSSDGRTTFVNEAMTRIIGGTKELVVSQNFHHLESWKVSGLLDDAETTLSTGAEKMRQVYIMTTFGKKVWLDCHLRRFKLGDEFQLLLIINDITSLKLAEQEREILIEDLQKALAKVRTLSGFLPICASCKKIRDDQGYWQQIESYIRDHSDAEFTHSICPECAKRLYPDLYKDQ